MQRPLFDKSIDELESAFKQQRSDLNFLRTLLEELSKRKSKGRANTLKTHALQALDETEKRDLKALQEKIKSRVNPPTAAPHEQASNRPPPKATTN
jgi:hypothetical protein